MSEEIGKHKGAVETLLHEQKELSRLLKIVQGQLERHINALEEAGVDTESFVEQLQSDQRNQGNQEKQREGSKEGASGSGNSESGDRGGSSDKPEEEEVDDFLEGEEDGGEDDFAPF